MDKEFGLNNADFSVDDKNTCTGYAVVWNEESVDLGGFREYIDKGSITEDTLKNSDILFTINHHADEVLARSYYGDGSLDLNLDDKGLRFSFQVPDTQLGHDFKEMVRRGDLRQCSFTFKIARDEDGTPIGDTWNRENDVIIRHVTKIDTLLDTSAVNTPAYPQTSLSLRNRDMLQKFKNKEKFLKIYDKLNEFLENL